MQQYVIRRLVQLVPVLLGVSIVVFGLLNLIPGDPARLFLGPGATPEDIAAMRSRLGLDQPLPKQYLTFVGGLLRGDLGTSIRTNRPVALELATRVPNTLKLAAAALIVQCVLGIPAGIISAARPNSWADHGFMLLALIGVSMPVFWLGLMLMLLFSLRLNLLPTGGNETWQHFILPGLTLGVTSAAVLARMTRSTMLEVLREDYIRTGRAKGLRERLVVYRHALRNAAIPIITLVGLETGALLGGAVLTETVFSINGLGRYVVQSIGFRDYPVVQGTVLILALAFMLVNLLVDLAYAVANPRIRYD